MSFIPKQEHHKIEAEITAFAEQEIVPYLQEADEKEELPTSILNKCKEQGLFGLIIPPQYGGKGCDMVTFCLILQKLSEFSPSIAVMTAVHNSVCAYPIIQWGTDHTKEKYLPKMATGEWIGAFGLTEANAGSDAANISTVAVPNTVNATTNIGDTIHNTTDKSIESSSFILNGSKVFITNGQLCHLAVILAKTSPQKRAKGTTCFIVDKSMSGFSAGKKEQKMGMRISDTTELHLNQVEVPKENILGVVDQGFSVIMETLNSSRIGIGAQAVGIATAVLNYTLQYAHNKTDLNGNNLYQEPGIQHQLAEMATEVEAARLLVLQSSYLKDNQSPFIKQGSMAKYFAAKTAVNVANRAVRILGLEGITNKHPIERFFRDAKITEIYEGTSEIQKLIIAKQLTI